MNPKHAATSGFWNAATNISSSVTRSYVTTNIVSRGSHRLEYLPIFLAAARSPREAFINLSIRIIGKNSRRVYLTQTYANNAVINVTAATFFNSLLVGGITTLALSSVLGPLALIAGLVAIPVGTTITTAIASQIPENASELNSETVNTLLSEVPSGFNYAFNTFNVSDPVINSVGLSIDEPLVFQITTSGRATVQDTYLSSGMIFNMEGVDNIRLDLTEQEGFIRSSSNNSQSISETVNIPSFRNYRTNQSVSSQPVIVGIELTPGRYRFSMNDSTWRAVTGSLRQMYTNATINLVNINTGDIIMKLLDTATLGQNAIFIAGDSGNISFSNIRGYTTNFDITQSGLYGIEIIPYSYTNIAGTPNIPADISQRISFNINRLSNLMGKQMLGKSNYGNKSGVVNLY